MKLTKKKLILVFVLIFIGMGTFFIFNRPKLPRIDRIILITLDTLRADHLSCYGYPQPTSPFIDSLAKKGILFKNAFAPMPSTVPSHASLFTSLYPIQLNVLKNGHKLKDSFLTLAEMLKGIGYQTAAFVSVNHLFMSGNLNQGFDVFDRPDLQKDFTYRRANEVVDAVIKWLEKQSANERLFLWIHLWDTHSPYDPPPKFLKVFTQQSDDELLSLTRLLINEHHIDLDFFGDIPEEGFREGSGISFSGYKQRSKAEKLLRMINAYDGEVLFADAEIERLYQYFQRRGLNSNALWIITSDHGEGLGNHRWIEHEINLYNELLRVPLIFFFPSDFYQHQYVEKGVELVDILPTIAELLGGGLTPTIGGRQGVSLVSLFSNVRKIFHNTSQWRQYLFSQRRQYDGPDPDDVISDKKTYEGEVYSIQDNKYKYIHRTKGEDEFYCLRDDPYEVNNIAGRESNEEKKLKRALTYQFNRLKPMPIVHPESVSKEQVESIKSLGYVQ